MNWSAFLTVMSGAKMDKTLVWGRACKHARTHTHRRRGRAWSLFIIHHLWLEHEKSWWISSALAAEVSGSVLSLIKSVSFLCHRDQFASQSRFSQKSLFQFRVQWLCCCRSTLWRIHIRVCKMSSCTSERPLTARETGFSKQIIWPDGFTE